MTGMQYQHALQVDSPIDDDILIELDDSHELESLDVPDIRIIVPEWEAIETAPVAIMTANV